MKRNRPFAAVLVLLPAALACAAEPLEFRISLDKKTFLPGESIIVAAHLKNTGQAARTLKEPNAAAFVVTHLLDRLNGGKREPVLDASAAAGGGGGWRAEEVELKPGHAISTSCELERGGMPILTPGEYVLRTRYHLLASGEEGYSDKANMVPAGELRLTVAEPQGEEKRNWERLTSAIAEPDTVKRVRLLEEFLAQTPKSAFRVRALDEINKQQWSGKDHRGYAESLRRMRAEPISQCRRHILAVVEADAREEQGDLQGAADALKDARSAASQWRRKDLEERAKKKAAEKKAP